MAEPAIWHDTQPARVVSAVDRFPDRGVVAITERLHRPSGMPRFCAVCGEWMSHAGGYRPAVTGRGVVAVSLPGVCWRCKPERGYGE